MRCRTRMQERMGLALEEARQSTDRMVLYIKSILFVVTKDTEEMSHQMVPQGLDVVLVFSLRSVKKEFGWCKKLYLSTTIILLVQIK
jgi:hypothetical protein